MDRHVYERMQALETSHWWFVARREILAGQIARLPIASPARILEVGSGTGGNLGMLARFGHVEAVEPDDASRAYSTNASGLNIKPGLLPDALPAYEEPFDLVAALDVVEHVEDDAGSIAALGRLLKPGGFLLTTVPAGAWMWSGHDVRHHHKRRYGLRQYRQLFEAAGLRVRRATYFNTVLFPPIAGVRLIKRLLRLQDDDAESMPPAPVNAGLRTLFASERHLLSAVDLPFGVSILVIAELPA